MTRLSEADAADIDLRQFLQPGDRLVVSQGPAEPLSVVRALVEQRSAIPNLSAFIGITFSGYLEKGLAEDVELTSYGCMGSLGKLADAGLLEVIPINYADLPWLMEHGPHSPDVAFVQVSPADNCGYHSFGVSVDPASEASRHARVVIAEVNDQMPATAGPARIHESQITAAVRVSRPLVEIPSPHASPVEEIIAKNVSSLVEDGATLQLGIGAVPSAVGRELCDKRGLRVYSGLVGDWLLDLASTGALELMPTKDLVSTGSVMGSQQLYDLAGASGLIVFKPISELNRLDVLASIPQFTAVNSAIQVDLTGQVNAEVVGSANVGVIGGQTDFLRGGQLSRGGRAIVAVPSTAAKGRVSRIVPRLDQGCVTTPKAYVDFVVTEHGIADLRGRSLSERAEALIQIAAPEFREELSAGSERDSRDRS